MKEQKSYYRIEIKITKINSKGNFDRIGYTVMASENYDCVSKALMQKIKNEMSY